MNRSFPGSLGKESSHGGGSTCKCPKSVDVGTSNGTNAGDANSRHADGTGGGGREDLGQNARDLVTSESKGHVSISLHKAGAPGARVRFLMVVAVFVSPWGQNTDDKISLLSPTSSPARPPPTKGTPTVHSPLLPSLCLFSQCCTDVIVSTYFQKVAVSEHSCTRTFVLGS